MHQLAHAFCVNWHARFASNDMCFASNDTCVLRQMTHAFCVKWHMHFASNDTCVLRQMTHAFCVKSQMHFASNQKCVLCQMTWVSRHITRKFHVKWHMNFASNVSTDEHISCKLTYVSWCKHLSLAYWLYFHINKPFIVLDSDNSRVFFWWITQPVWNDKMHVEILPYSLGRASHVHEHYRCSCRQLYGSRKLNWGL